MLSDRRQRILQALIEEYVANAMPVGSRTLTERYRLGVSPATIRNELSYLEDEGFLMQPHTSSGRIPTDYGYRAFVDDLIQHKKIARNNTYDSVIDELKQSARELDELLSLASESLARFTHCLSVVLAPEFLGLTIKQISLIQLASDRFLIVLVTEDGQVFNRNIETEFSFESDELALIQGLVNNFLCGKTIQEADCSFEFLVENVYHSPLFECVISEIKSCFKDSGTLKKHSLGMSSLMAMPEFAHSSAVIPVLQMLDDEMVFLEILESIKQDEASSNSTYVKIGHENLRHAHTGVSVIARAYGDGEARGIVAVIGPTRMDYSKVIAAVNATSAALEK